MGINLDIRIQWVFFVAVYLFCGASRWLTTSLYAIPQLLIFQQRKSSHQNNVFIPSLRTEHSYSAKLLHSYSCQIQYQATVFFFPFTRVNWASYWMETYYQIFITYNISIHNHLKAEQSSSFHCWEILSISFFPPQFFVQCFCSFLCLTSSISFLSILCFGMSKVMLSDCSLPQTQTPGTYSNYVTTECIQFSSQRTHHNLQVPIRIFHFHHSLHFSVPGHHETSQV